MLCGNAVSQGLAPCPPARCLTVTYRHLTPSNPAQQPASQPTPSPTAPPAPQLSPLPVPRFSPQSGSVLYGTDISLSVDKTTAVRTLEYSSDNGQTWTTGTSFPLLQQGTYLARTREGDRTSETSAATLTYYFGRMFVLGNSITVMSPVPVWGWQNNNGMAASSPDKDFAHILERNLKAANPQVQMKLLSGGGFEREFWSFDYDKSLSEHLDGYAPDLIIVRIGENMSDDEVAKPEREFKARYRQLLDKLTQYSGHAKVICTTSFWDQSRASAMIREVAAERGYPVADLHTVLYNRPDRDSFRAVTEYADPGVGAHPNDRGMAEIARLILEKVW